MYPQGDEIRTRTDHEAFLRKVFAGKDRQIQDHISILGQCLEHVRRVRQTCQPLESSPADAVRSIRPEQNVQVQIAVKLNRCTLSWIAVSNIYSPEM